MKRKKEPQPELAELAALRLRLDLPYRMIAQAINVTTPTAHRLITNPHAHANDRTLNRIRIYLAAHRRRTA